MKSEPAMVFCEGLLLPFDVKTGDGNENVSLPPD